MFTEAEWLADLLIVYVYPPPDGSERRDFPTLRDVLSGVVSSAMVDMAYELTCAWAKICRAVAKSSGLDQLSFKLRMSAMSSGDNALPCNN